MRKSEPESLPLRIKLIRLDPQGNNPRQGCQVRKRWLNATPASVYSRSRPNSEVHVGRYCRVENPNCLWGAGNTPDDINGQQSADRREKNYPPRESRASGRCVIQWLRTHAGYFTRRARKVGLGAAFWGAKDNIYLW